MPVSIEDIQAAQERIKPFIHHTPIFTSNTFNQMTHASLFFKCENFQKIGAFKIRGATNAVLSLPADIAEKGVATHSSGNHAQAIALAAKNRGIPAYIVMPNNSTEVKKQAVQGYGAQITFCEPTMEAREATLHKIIEKTGATFLHPYDNEKIIAGQGTVALELMEQCNELDLIIIPIGGGGLIAGCSIAIDALYPQIKVIGAEPLQANDAFLSFQNKAIVAVQNQRTICDGLLTPIGKITFPIILRHVQQIFTASEESIIKATKLIWERMKVIVEPSAAITFAIILENPEYFQNKKIGLILSGGNVDIKAIAQLF